VPGGRWHLRRFVSEFFGRQAVVVGTEEELSGGVAVFLQGTALRVAC
jgi:hypothetical protein